MLERLVSESLSLTVKAARATAVEAGGRPGISGAHFAGSFIQDRTATKWESEKRPDGPD